MSKSRNPPIKKEPTEDYIVKKKYIPNWAKTILKRITKH